MNKKTKEKSQIVSDEIDLVMLLAKIMKYKIFIIIISVILTLPFVFKYMKAPVRFTSSAELCIGKIENTNIDTVEFVKVFLSEKSKENPEKYKFLKNVSLKLNMSRIKNLRTDIHFFIISSTTGDKNKSFENVKKASNMIVGYHSKIFKKVVTILKEKNKNSTHPVSAAALINTYNFNTKVVRPAFLPKAPIKKYSLSKLVFIFILSVFITTFAFLIFDFFKELKKNVK